VVGTCKLSGCGRPALSLHGAAANDNLAAIESLIAAGAEVNARDGDGFTPSPAIIEALLDAGADATARDAKGKTPWDYAEDRVP